MAHTTDGRRPDTLDREVRQAALRRDAARGRLRFLTQASIATTALLGGAFAALAAGSTHTKKAVLAPVAHPTGRDAVLVQAPAPPLVEAQSAAPAASAPAPPASAPDPGSTPPVVVSGGS